MHPRREFGIIGAAAEKMGKIRCQMTRYFRTRREFASNVVTARAPRCQQSFQVFRLQTEPRAKVVLEPKIPVDGSGKTQPAGFRKIPAETTNDFHRIRPRPHKTLSGLAESRVPAYRLPLPSPNRSDRSLPRQAANRE